MMKSKYSVMARKSQSAAVARERLERIVQEHITISPQPENFPKKVLAAVRLAFLLMEDL